jgi:osmotically-inducible protein OsmY
MDCHLQRQLAPDWRYIAKELTLEQPGEFKMICNNQRITLLVMLVLAAVSQGCTTPSDATPSEAGAPAAIRVSIDHRLKSAIQNTIDEGVYFRNRPLVEVHHRDGVVLLTGQVTSEEDKSKISNSVAFSAGGELRRLSNELRVVESVDLSLADADAKLADAAKVLLATIEPSLAEQTETVVENSVIYLLGRVTQAQGDAAAQLVSGLEGVAAVKVVFDYTD